MSNIENLEGEIWKDIEGFEGYYQVSNMGRVKSLDRIIESVRYANKEIKGSLLKMTIGGKGYRIVKLHKSNIGKNLYVHRLIAVAFIPNPENKPEVNHIDLNRSNNDIFNLEWVTHKENVIHAVKSGAKIYIRGEKHHSSILTFDQALKIRELLKTKTYSEVGRIFGIHKGVIRNIGLNITYKK